MRAEGIKEYPVDMICQTIGIGRRAFYYRKRIPQTEKEQETIKLKEEAVKLFKANNSEYGRIRLHKAMKEAGHNISESRTRDLMKLANIKPKTTRKYKATTNSKHNYEVAENLLKQDFTADKPNQKWCGDSTYIWTDQGWLYVAGIIDLCDKTCVGLTFSERHTQELMIEALDNAKREYRPGIGTIFHSDRGVQYASNAYKKKLEQYGMIQSMSRSGNPYDNAAIESFWGTVKTGCVFGERFRTRKAAIKAIFEYVFGFYNTRRYHSAIGLMVPLIYREALLKAA